MVLLLGISAQEGSQPKTTFCTSSMSPTTSETQVLKSGIHSATSTFMTATPSLTPISIPTFENEAKSPNPNSAMLTARDYRRRRRGGLKIPTAVFIAIPLIVAAVCCGGAACCAIAGGKRTRARELQQQQLQAQQQRNSNGGFDVEALGRRGVGVREPPRAVTIGGRGRGPREYENEYFNEIGHGHGRGRGDGNDRREDAPPPYSAF
ncbi:uncharacterized protein DSM5745_02274 [Aspergillus mulundensis]|uniref:Uncharacterized protein n=1 Tax=Aspergillus mulundensis TaxID=1810919 RepID=A0A3D8SW65_9EURO|nr:hypothetical protein DSM5745_02274 [Aspergillus mulundensis]RDW90499.1 hypothetical protein DSM5745_02274 [Aspergillus mulundensis]